MRALSQFSRPMAIGGAFALALLACLYALGLGVWLSLALALLVLLAVAIGAFALNRSAQPEEAPSAEITGPDLRELGLALTSAADRLEGVAPRLPAKEQDGIFEMARHLGAIHRNVEAETAGFRPTKAFADALLPGVVTAIETYADGASRVQPTDAEAAMLDATRWQIRSFGAAIRKIDRATQTPDLAALEAEVAALSSQLAVAASTGAQRGP